jgi:hypothetical protein
MTTDIQINKPAPIETGMQLELFDRDTDVKLAIQALEAGKPLLITAFYSNGLLLLRELQLHLKRKLPNKSFQEQRAFRSEYRKLSNLVLIEIVAHQLNVKKSTIYRVVRKAISRNDRFPIALSASSGIK